MTTSTQPLSLHLGVATIEATQPLLALLWAAPLSPYGQEVVIGFDDWHAWGEALRSYSEQPVHVEVRYRAADPRESTCGDDLAWQTVDALARAGRIEPGDWRLRGSDARSFGVITDSHDSEHVHVEYVGYTPTPSAIFRHPHPRPAH